MGFEKSEPRNHSIFFWGVVSSFLLLSLVPLFHDYFGSMTQAEEAAKYEQDEDVRDAIAAKYALLNEGSMTIDAAMDRVASGNRNNTPVMPRANDGYNQSEEDVLGTLGAVAGWSGRDGTAAEAEATEAILNAREQERRRREEAARRAAEAAAAAAAGAGTTPTALPFRPFRGQVPARGATP